MIDKRLVWLVFLFFFAPLRADHSVVTYDFSGGRFGDNLLSYLHAKWFSYEHNLPLLYKPFPYSSSMVLHEKEIHYRDRLTRKKLGLRPSFRAPLEKWSAYSKIPLISFCYQCPYFPEDPTELAEWRFFSFSVDWKDQVFRNMMREYITPKDPIRITKPPEGVISIALHVREGGGFDQGMYQLENPLKFPPLSFYIEGIKHIAALFPEKMLYCHLFTDAQHPEQLAENMLQNLPSTISLHYREDNNRHDSNVLEDFFSLFEFDVLIRPISNFSIIPSLLKDYAIVYAPKKFQASGKIISITEADIQINSSLYQRLAQ